jgi:hypothetical protein
MEFKNDIATNLDLQSLCYLCVDIWPHFNTLFTLNATAILLYLNTIAIAYWIIQSEYQA